MSTQGPVPYGRGLLLSGMPRLASRALPWYLHDMETDPTPDIAYSRALAFYQSGDTRQARDICLRLMAAMPGNPKLIHFNGLIYLRERNYQEAARWITSALELDPTHPIYHNNLGNVFREAGRLEEAAAEYRAAVAVDPGFAQGYNNLGMVMAEQNRPGEALAFYKKAIDADSDFFQPFNNLGELCSRLGKKDEAAAFYRQALERNPDSGVTYYNLGVLHCEGRRFEAAVDLFNKALSLNHGDKKLYNNLGACLGEVNRKEEALTCFSRALEMDPEYADAHNNLGELYLSQCRLDDAVKRFETAMRLAPGHATAEFNRSLALLTQGRFPSGWEGYCRRWEKEGISEPDYGLDRWDGGALNGDYVVIYDEQGIGDTIQFLRYLPMVKRLGGRIIFSTKPALIRLLGQYRAVDHLCVSPTDTARLARKASCQVALMDLPGVFGTTETTIPGPSPYLDADPGLAQAWKKRISQTGALKVGIVWCGSPGHKNDHNRSVAMERFLGLASVPDTLFFSLQKEVSPLAGKALERSGIIDLGSGFSDFADTAAAISLLDLVVSVDTSVAHLSGAMGKPTWTLLPFSPDWRWMLDRNDTPWYPAMTLFRQPGISDWDPVFEAVMAALNNPVKKSR